MQQAHLIISGFVQGVGYRQFVRKEADKLRVFGWVKNVPQGKVEAVLQGNKGEIEQLIDICRKGPFMSEVKDVQVAWEEVEVPFSEFFIDN